MLSDVEPGHVLYSEAGVWSAISTGRLTAPAFFLAAGCLVFFGVPTVFLAGCEPVDALEGLEPAPRFAASDLLFRVFDAVAVFASAQRFFWAAAIRAFPSADIPRFFGAGASGFRFATRLDVPSGLPGPRRFGAAFGASSIRSSTLCKCVISARRL